MWRPENLDYFNSLPWPLVWRGLFYPHPALDRKPEVRYTLVKITYLIYTKLPS